MQRWEVAARAETAGNDACECAGILPQRSISIPWDEDQAKYPKVGGSISQI